MLTYQLQRRVCRIKNEKEFTFPNEVKIEIYLEPTEQFGVITGEARTNKTAVRKHRAVHFWDANTGKWGVRSDPPLESIETVVEWTNLRLEMQGSKLLAKTECETFKELHDLLIALHYAMPILLNLELAEPPTVKYTRGQVGDAIFQWELAEAKHVIETTTKETQEKRVADSFSRLYLTDIAYRGLVGALYYFYVARRLVESGHSPYEFLPEVVLNLCKILQVLFGEDRDNVRTELAKFGYSREEIEGKFIPIMILRNELDVGHVSMKLFKREQLDALYKYLEYSEHDFRYLLKRVLEKVKEGDYVLQPDPDLRLDKDDLKMMKKLISIFEKRASIPLHH